jgi:uncharacterized protein GlcG (DUF336 family)
MTGISLTKAKRIISATFAKARELDLKPLGVLVVDAGGHPVAFERQDGASAGRYAIADGKAHAAIMTGLPSSALMARAEQQPHSATAFSGALGGRFVSLAGGILVRDKRGNLLGAVGVTGDTSENDAIAGTAGVEAAGYTAEA